MMMSRATRVFGLLAAGLLFVSAQAQAQAVYVSQPASKVWIEGTSNKSDWTANATEFTVSVTMDADGATPGVEGAELSVASARLVSGRSTIMDRLMHDALKVDEHPNITFVLTGATPGAASGNTFALQTKGRLTLAGTTKEVDLAVQGEKLANGQMRFTGQYPLNMKDYGITPPSAMFGALRTAENVTVNFDLVVAPK